MASAGSGRRSPGQDVGSSSTGGSRARAAALGVAAWIVGYVVALAFTLVLGDEGESSVPDTGEFAFGEITGPSETEALWKMGGNFFYSAHFVPTEFGVDAADFGGIDSTGGSVSIGINLIPNTVPTDGGQWLPLLLVPPLALAAAGWLAVRWARVDPRDAPRTGASVALGYLPLSLVGLFLFTLEYSATSVEYGEISVTIAPSLLLGVVMAGVVYPLAFGAAGGYLWRRRHAAGTARSRPREPGPAGPR